MSVTVGSLFSDDLGLLEDLELLPPDTAEDAAQVPVESQPAPRTATRDVPSPLNPSPPTPVSRVIPFPSETSVQASAEQSSVRSHRYGARGDIPWFEEMLEGSHLGRIMKRRRRFADSKGWTSSAEWEISEWGDGSKRGI